MSRRTVRVLTLLALAGAITAALSAAKGPREVAVTTTEDPKRAAATFASWRRFDFVPADASPHGPSARATPLAEREIHRLLQHTIAQAFVQRGYHHETAERVDFVIEWTFDHPGDPPPGSKTWLFGKKTNWLEIRLRAAGDRTVLWTGRAFHVLRKKRDGKADDDMALRFLAASQAIARSFSEAAANALEPSPSGTHSHVADPDT